MTPVSPRCIWKTEKHVRCRRRATHGSTCYQHNYGLGDILAAVLLHQRKERAA